MTDGAPVSRHGLPVRRVEARPDVLARLSGEAADVDDAHVATVAPADGGFPWAITAVSNESPAGGATDGGDDADNVSRDDTDDDADLTDWQRQWLDVSAPEDEPDESIPTVDAGGWWEGIPAVRQLLLYGLEPACRRCQARPHRSDLERGTPEARDANAPAPSDTGASSGPVRRRVSAASRRWRAVRP